jgi:transposase
MDIITKTLEFKLYPKPHQAETLDQWMKAQQHVWNIGLSLLIRHDRFTAYNKIDKNHAACCPVPWSFRYIPNGTKDGYIAVPYSPYGYVNKKGDYITSCPIPTDYQFPEIKSQHKFSLSPWLAYRTLHERRAPDGFNIDVDLIKSAPAKMMQGTVDTLHTSWQEFKKGKRKRPRFKGKNNPIETIRSGDHLNIKGDNQVLLSKKMGTLTVKGIKNRTAHVEKICQGFGITKRATGYYLNLAVQTAVDTSIKHPDVAIAVDPGVIYATTTDYGRQVESPRFLKKELKRLKREQRKLSRRVKGGKNREKQRQKVAKIHEKLKRQRRAFWQKETTYFASMFGAIAIEDNNYANMGKRPKAKPREDGKGYLPNQAKAKAGLNQALRDVGAGQLKVLLQSKALTRGNEVQLVPSHYNSQTCSRCGSVSKCNRKSQSEFKCISCGFSANADVNAAINVHNRVQWEGTYKRFDT